MSRLLDDLAALEVMSPAQLRERWTAMGEGTAPAVPALLLRRLLAQRLQECCYGSLPAMVARELARIAREGVSSQLQPARNRLTPGVRLVREWNGQILVVDVVEEGFAYADRTWRSLSEIACHVTGAHWSGPRFFGLTSRG